MSEKGITEELVGSGVLKSQNIINAFYHVDRQDFVLPEYKEKAYLNQPLPILHGQTISQPWTVAFMLELLKPQTGQKILDIGLGSGWQAGLLAYIVSHDDDDEEVAINERGLIISVEIVPEVFEFGRKNLAKYNFLKDRIVETHCVNGVKGFGEKAPFDRIIVAASGDKVPSVWQEQLKIGGRLVTPCGNRVVLYKKITDKDFEIERYDGFLFVPLVDE